MGVYGEKNHATVTGNCVCGWSAEVKKNLGLNVDECEFGLLGQCCIWEKIRMVISRFVCGP